VIHQNLTPFAWGPVVTSRKDKDVELAVCVRGTYTLVPGEPPAPIEDPLERGFMSGETFADEDINQLGASLRGDDFAHWKLHGEALLRGSFHHADGTGREGVARFSVGTWSKQIQVTGPRAYKKGMLLGGSAGEPQPFRSMPLTWENAYGGAGYASNPVGRGFTGEELPTLSLPGQPVRKIGQRDVPPATFLPISSHWPQRSGKRGRNYGKQWQKARAPFFSDDFDWTYYQSAPPDQWVEGYWRGDETLTFENLHPTQARWQTQLPAVRVRSFVKTTDGRIHEPDMHLDTVFADVDDGKLYLTWRGHAPIQRIDMTDVAVVLLAHEPLADAPTDAQVYIDQLKAFEDDPVGLKAAFPAGFLMFADAIEAVEQAELDGTPMPDLQKVRDELPPECPMPPWFLAAVAGDEDPLGIEDKFPPGMLDGSAAPGAAEAGGLADPDTQAGMFADLEKLGDDPGLAAELLEGIVGLLPADKQAGLKEGIRALAETLDAVKADAGADVFTKAATAAKSSPPAKPAAESYGDMMATANEQVSIAGDAADTAETAAKVQEAQANLDKAPQSLDDAVAQGLKPLEDIDIPDVPDLPDGDAVLAEQAAMIDREEARMRDKLGDHPMLGIFAMGRNLIENAPRPGQLAPDLSAIPAGLQRAQEALAAQGVSAAAMAPLSALIAKVQTLVDNCPKPDPLPEGEFVAQDLRRRDFSGQDLRGQTFCKADLTGALFCSADLSGADFTQADLTKADLTGATLTEATFKRANLSKAQFTKVTAPRASFADADITATDFANADLTGAKFTNARGEKADFGSATLIDADARFSDLSKADLRAADLTRANLSFATLHLVKADRADLTEANLELCKLTRSRLHDAVLRNSRSTMAFFTASNLTGADLRGCRYEKCDFSKATLDRADLRGSDLSQTLFRDAIATAADFREAVLTGCSTTGEARFTQCDFRHAEGPRSVWMDVELTGSTFRHGDFGHAYFDGARGSDIDFVATGLKYANFRRVQLCRVSFAFADLAGAVFQDATVDDGDFQRSNCYDAKFLGARATRCRFSDAFLVGVQLDDPDNEPPGGER
jgi:uncharacterized protein YjbI with pentapeptide repeats